MTLRGDVSVCTIARGREAHLRNMVAGLARQTTPVGELVIAHMQPTPYADLPQTPFPIVQIPVDGACLPLARARNAAARAARGDALVFLDVDCIPMPGLVEAYAPWMRNGVCVMGETRYLPQTDPSEKDPNTLWAQAIQHPARRFSLSLGPGAQHIRQTTEFWSLSFALTRATFTRLGGFDEDFSGYGGEDTDFAVRLGIADVDLWFEPGARAVHQWHRVQKPPLGQFEDIIRNARLFHRKHGQWCMDYWLGQFAEAGFINWKSDRIDVLNRPSANDLEAAICDGSVAFS